MTADREQFVVDLPQDIKDALGALSASQHKPMTEIAREAIAAYLGIEYGGLVRATWSRTKLDIPSGERAALKRWGTSAASKLMARGDFDNAKLIATAVVELDYSTLQALKAATEEIK